MRNTLWFLLAGSSGGLMRARILLFLKHKPQNAHQVAKALGIDYKTARYHLELLAKNGALDVAAGAGSKQKYGSVYIHSAQLEAVWSQFSEIWSSIASEKTSNGTDKE